MKNCHLLVLSTVVALLVLTACQGEQNYRDQRVLPTQYPTARIDTTTSFFWDTSLPDPYRWLTTDSTAIARWVVEQNILTQNFMSQIPYYKQIQDRLDELHRYERMSLIRRFGDRYFFSLNNGKYDQDLVYIQESLNSPREVFFDPNRPFRNSSSNLKTYECSADGKWMAMYVNITGDYTDEMLIWNVDNRSLVTDETIYGLKYGSMCWSGDGFYYGCYEPDGPNSLEAKVGQQIRYHKIGTPPSEDELIVPTMTDRKWNYQFAAMGDNQRWVFLMPGTGSKNNALFLLDHENPQEGPKLMIDDPETYNIPIGIANDTIYIYSNYHRPFGRILKAPLHKPEKKNWREVIAASDNYLVAANGADGHILLTYLVNGHHETSVYDLTGKHVKDIPNPEYCMTSFQSTMESKEIFYTCQSFAIPTSVYKYDLISNTSVPYIVPNTAIKPSDYITELAMVPSTEGKSVPVYITRRRDVKLNGKAPCVLVGYGGFGTNITPNFNIKRLVLLEQGCIMAQVCARGGSECGNTWHNDAKHQRKENTFADFKAAIDYLISNGYTSANRLGLQASGIGALAVAVLANRYPDQFAVGVGIEPMLDVLHYQDWNKREAKRASEIGAAIDSREMFYYLCQYDPILNLKAGHYPAMMMVTSNENDYIHPSHAYKYVAALQGMDSGLEPTLLLVKNGGHHRTLAEQIDEYATFCSFFLYNIGIPYKSIE